VVHWQTDLFEFIISRMLRHKKIALFVVVALAFTVSVFIKAKLNDGRMRDATIRAVVRHGNETKLNIDYGHEETATIGLWQVVRPGE
jgi:hypothetical protein